MIVGVLGFSLGIWLVVFIFFLRRRRYRINNYLDYFFREYLISSSEYKEYKNIYNDYFLYHINVLKLPKFEHIAHDKKSDYIIFYNKSNKILKILLWLFVFLISTMLILEFIDDFILEIY